MHPCLTLLHSAFDLLEQEKRALSEERSDDLDALAARRAVLLEEAWSLREGCDPGLLEEALGRMREEQVRLERDVSAALDRTRSSMGTLRKHQGYFSTARAARRYHQTARHFNLVS